MPAAFATPPVRRPAVPTLVPALVPALVLVLALALSSLASAGLVPAPRAPRRRAPLARPARPAQRHATARSHKPADPSKQPSNASCCSFSEAQLRALSGVGDKCGSATFSLRLDKKCDICPLGTCRVNGSCVCAQRFLSSAGAPLRASCAASFRVPWPASVSREDVAYRSCRSDPPQYSRSNVSCCALDADTIDAMAGTSSACYPGVRVVQPKPKCGACYAGLCRLENVCHCPRVFRDGLAQKCEALFGAKWPDSAGRTERGYEACGAMQPPRLVSGTLFADMVPSGGDDEEEETGGDPGASAEPVEHQTGTAASGTAAGAGDAGSGADGSLPLPADAGSVPLHLANKQSRGLTLGLVFAGLGIVFVIVGAGVVAWMRH